MIIKSSINTVNGLIYTAEALPDSFNQIVVICVGYNGFYNYGMFPTIQNELFKHGIASICFNYSHAGIGEDEDVFTDLDRYQKNCRRLEVEDTIEVYQNIKNRFPFKKYSILGHSMGAVVAVFTALKLKYSFKEDINLILLNGLSTLNNKSQEMLEDWKKQGIYLAFNPRTKQHLPLGEEYLAEVLDADNKWNVENALSNLNFNRTLVAHGTADEAVPMWHGVKNYKALMCSNKLFIELPDASHTLNTKHPEVRDSDQLQFFIQHLINWLNQY